MTILVTGGTGPGRITPAETLGRGGCQLPWPGAVGQGASRRRDAGRGRILDPNSLVAAVEGVSAIVHLAAVFRTPDADAVWKANLDGTRNLIVVSREHAPDTRFIMASTILIYDADGQRPGP